MTTLIDDRRVRAGVATPARYFYFHMALACMAVAFLGFAPTYWLPLASGSFPPMPVVHFHGMLFFTWTLYFAFQTWLAASGWTWLSTPSCGIMKILSPASMVIPSGS